MESTTGMLTSAVRSASFAVDCFSFGYMGSGDTGHRFIVLFVRFHRFKKNKSMTIFARESRVNVCGITSASPPTFQDRITIFIATVRPKRTPPIRVKTRRRDERCPSKLAHPQRSATQKTSKTTRSRAASPRPSRDLGGTMGDH
jgi:hypothetical protein